MITKEKYEDLRKMDTSSVYADIREAIGRKSFNTSETATLLGAFALYKMQENPKNNYENFDTFINECLSKEMGDFSPCYISHSQINEGSENEEDTPWDLICSLKGKYTLDELAACVLFGEKDSRLNEIPLGIDELIYRALDMDESHYISNFLLGGGSYIVENILKHPNQKSAGTVLGEHLGMVTYIRLALLGKEVNLTDDGVVPDEKYDRIFAQMLIPQQYLYDNLACRYAEYIDEQLKENTSFEWKYIDAMMSFLNSNGKLAVIMRVNGLSNKKDILARTFFVNNGILERVILLPERLYEDRSKMALLVFSSGNTKVKFHDASKIGTHRRIKGKLVDVVETDAIDAILSAEFDDTNTYKIVSASEIEQMKYCLDPQRYIVSKAEKNNEHEETLHSLGMKVERAAQFTYLDYYTEEDTGIYCVMSGDIQDGVICEDLKKLSTTLDEKYLKFTLREGDLLITRNGNPYKVAVFENVGGRKCVANGNLYIVRNNYLKVNPYYIKAFFESSKGEELLNAYSNKISVNMITKKSLVNIPFPFPDFEKRQEIAITCETISRDIKEKRNLIAAERDQIKEMFV